MKTVDSELTATMTVERERDSFTEETTDDDILTVIRTSEFLAVTAQWVAGTVGIDRRPVHQRLEKLQGELEHGN